MTSSDTTTDGALHVTRTIPVPTTVSAEAQAMLAFGAAYAGGGTGSEPAPEDHDGWRRHIAMLDNAVNSVMAPRAANAAVDVETATIGGVPIFALTPRGAPAGPDAPIYLDIHGGALIMGGGEACRVMATLATASSGLHTWSVDYRMPPDHPYPSALDDCLTVYKALLDQRRPDQIVVGGGSAGGNLAAALMLKARAEGLPMPAGLVLITPEVDLTESGDTFSTNLGIDTVLTQRLTGSINIYANGADLTDPYLSPLFGDLSAFPPTFLQSGTRDLFLSNTVRMHRALRDAGVNAELHVWEAMPHGGFMGAPEDAQVSAELRRFLASHLG
jgi:monoterpene epsilon-lactone hydrolase